MATETNKIIHEDDSESDDEPKTIEPKKFEFNDDIWGEIMSYVAPSIETILTKWGIDKLHDLFTKTHKKRFTNMKASSIPLEKRRLVLLKPLMKYHHKYNLYNYIEPIKKSEKKSEDKPMELSVGDKVTYRGDGWWNRRDGGIILKVNKKSYTVQFYESREIHYNLHTWEDKIPSFKKTVSKVTPVDDYRLVTFWDENR